jgi:hypothetical protein
MKHLKKPTREQKILMQKKKLRPEDWMVERETAENVVLVHRHFPGTKRILPKEVKHDSY